MLVRRSIILNDRSAKLVYEYSINTESSESTRVIPAVKISCKIGQNLTSRKLEDADKPER